MPLYSDSHFVAPFIVLLAEKLFMQYYHPMSTTTELLSVVSSPLELDLWQLDKITDLFENGYPTQKIADQV
jgi:hypothetical protein